MSDVIGFRIPAASTVGFNQTLDDSLARLSESFAPTVPTAKPAQFAGRRSMLQELIASIEEYRNHIVLYGPRGSGKTSIGLTLLAMAQRAAYHTAYVSCGHGSSLQSIFETALAELSLRFCSYFDSRSPDADQNATFRSLLTGQLTAQRVCEILASIVDTRLLIVLDEFDRIADRNLVADLVEIIKTVSDYGASVQFIIIGVTNDVDTLIGTYSPISRILHAVRVDNMADADIGDLIDICCRQTGIACGEEARQLIVGTVKGRPYAARLVGMLAARSALIRGAAAIDKDDVSTGVHRLAGHFAASGLTSVFEFARRNALNLAILKAITQIARFSDGQFSFENVLSRFTIEGRRTAEAALNDLCISSSDVLTQTTTGNQTYYRFKDARFEVLVMLLGNFPEIVTDANI